MITSSDIAQLLGKELQGDDIEIAFPRFIENAEEGSVVFASIYSEETCSRLNAIRRLLVIACGDFDSKLTTPHILSDNPRLDFSRVFRRFWPEPRRKTVISPYAVIGQGASIGSGVSIGHYTIIGDNVRIGEGTSISHHCHITDGVQIGRNCRIESHCAIGQSGWWFTQDDDGCYLDLPHHGSVVIGDNVQIGSFTDIDRGLFAVANTTIEDNVRINDKVHIGHGARISAGARLAIGASVSGETQIGRNCWIGPGSLVAHCLSICDNVTTSTPNPRST